MSAQLVLAWDAQAPAVNGDTPPVYQHPIEALESKLNRPAQPQSQPQNGVSPVTQPTNVDALSVPSKHIYYRLYQDHTGIPSNHPCDPSEPFLGKLARQELAPPRSIKLLKSFIANVEGIDVNRITAIYMSGDDEKPAEDSMSVVRAAGNPGSSTENPIAVIIAKETAAVVVEPPRIVISETTPTSETVISHTTSSSRVLPLLTRSLTQQAPTATRSPTPGIRSPTPSSSFTITPTSEPALARFRRSRVKSSVKPDGWLTGLAKQTPHLVEFSPPGRSLRKNTIGARIPTGTEIYVHPEVIYYDRSPLHRVIVPSDKRLGYLSPNEINFDDVVDISPVGGNSWHVIMEE